MPSITLRPDGLHAEQGWSLTSGTLLDVIRDNNPATGATQDEEECNLIVTLQDLSDHLADPTLISVDSIKASIIARGGREGASTVAIRILSEPAGDILTQSSAETIDVFQTHTTSTIYSLTSVSAIDDVAIQVEPNEQGTDLVEVFLTVEYSEISGKVSISDGKVSITSGKLTI
tara:strand:+ start:575 stop:1096 length:522 start_codon:yes stop_codon:yes gene_type:complete